MPLCTACGTENPAAARFCMGCAAVLAPGCSGCGGHLPASARFCPACGHPVAAAAEPPAALPPGSAAERRHLTVMFCDLVDSVGLGQRLDPEDLLDVLTAYRGFSGEVIDRFGGHIAQYLGDGLVVYFGYPQAHENDAERAVRAALEILQRLEELNRRLGAAGVEHVALRIGIHSGPVVVGGSEDAAELAVGSTVNLAARLESVASPDTAAISEATARLLRGAAELEDRGAMTLKGFREPVHVYRPLHLREDARHERLAATALTGRESEAERLAAAWTTARAGRGRVVFLSGEAGIGKSRLAAALFDRTSAEARWFELAGSSYHTDAVLFPVVVAIEREAGLGARASRAANLEKLRALLGRSPSRSADRDALIEELLGLAEAPPSAENPELRRRRLLSALADWLTETPDGQPRVLLIEDLHWFDPTTLALVEGVRERVADRPVLVLATYRPGLETAWTLEEDEEVVSLGPLAPTAARRVIREVAGGRALPPHVVDEIITKADGIPLHIEELTRAVLEAETGGGPIAVPSSLQDSMMERLDRLPDAKEVAQLASVFGRDFRRDHLVAVSGLRDAAVDQALDRLVEAGLIHPRAAGPGRSASFRFSHMLLRDAAHESMLRARRRELHRKVAQMLSERFPELGERDPGLLAMHYENARVYDRAIPYRLRAGEGAIAKTAYIEGVRHFERGLEALRKLPASPDRDVQELRFCAGLGTGLIATRGYASEEVHRNYARAEELCDAIGDPPAVLPVLYSLWNVQMVGAERTRCEGLLDRLQARTRHDPDAARIAAVARAMTDFYEGHYEAATRGMEVATRDYDAKEFAARTALFADDPLLIGASNLGWCLALVGRIEDAFRQQAAMEQLIETEIDSPFALVAILNYGLAVAFELRDPDRVEAAAERVVVVAEEQGFPFWGAIATSGLGWARAYRGDRAAIALIREGVEAYRMTGARTPLAYRECYLIDALARNGELEEALVRVEAALDVPYERLDRFYDAELHRQRGEILRGLGREDDAHAALAAAVSLARTQGAGWLLLRALNSRIGAGFTEQLPELVAHLESFPTDLDVDDLRRARDIVARHAA